MPITKDGVIVDDSWDHFDGSAPLPDDGDLILSLERLLEEGAELARRRGRTGVRLANTDDVEEIEFLLPHLALVTLEFPAFTDGRAYSQARRLRTSLGYTGELRATGNVLADQAGFMARVGFDSFETASGQDPKTWQAASRSMRLAYQSGYEGSVATRYGVKRSGACNTIV